MKDEIKEIIDGLNVVIKQEGSLELDFKECKKILDYITLGNKLYDLQEENERLNNVINELKNGLKEEIDRLEKVALENKNNKFEFDKLVLIRGKVIDIYDELIYEIYENKWKKIEKE